MWQASRLVQSFACFSIPDSSPFAVVADGCDELPVRRQLTVVHRPRCPYMTSTMAVDDQDAALFGVSEATGAKSKRSRRCARN
jgi:hypothetical protein